MNLNGVSGQQVMQEERQMELLRELTRETQKQVYYSRVLGISSVGIFLVLVISFFVLVPKVTGVLTEVTTTLEDANTAIAGITDMSETLKTMGINMNQFITDNANSASEVMTSIDNIDFEGLNKGIQDLSDVVEPLANFFNKFK